MRTRSRRFWIGATAIALSWVLGHSQSGQAQLFPNLPIQRSKPPCDQEAPFYKMVRQNYYGYFPTCWRKFPPGWTAPCPNPEKPDYEASKAKIPLQKDPDTFLQSGGGGGMGLGGEDEFGPLPPANGGNRQGRKPGPDLPGGRSPFDLDNPPANPPGGRAPGASPFDTPGAAAVPARRSVKPVASLPNLGELTPAPPVVSPTTSEPPAVASPESPPAIPDPAVGPTSASRILTPSNRKAGLLGGVRGLFGGDRR